MSPHWLLAWRYAAWVAAMATLGAVIIWLFFGASTAGAFGYGALVGIVSSLSTAVTVSLITKPSSMGSMMLGVASFGARYAFAAGALGVPAYLGSWPAVAMLGGFALVYLVENVVLLPLAASALSVPNIGADIEDTNRTIGRRAEI